MNIERYRPCMTAEMLMGPNSVRILQELMERHPLSLQKDDLVLDLGCGTGLTSWVIAEEIGARIYANDLWVAAEDNAKRFEAWGIGKRVTPVREDANALSFEKEMFHALVSVDAYHYFGTGKGFFEEKILPFLKEGAVVMIGIPGMKDEYAGCSEEFLHDWLGDEAYMFRSQSEWKEIIGTHERIESVETWEMDCFDPAWDEWFATGHEYAAGDKRFFETLIRPYTCFVGIYIRLK